MCLVFQKLHSRLSVVAIFNSLAPFFNSVDSSFIFKTAWRTFQHMSISVKKDIPKLRKKRAQLKMTSSVSREPPLRLFTIFLFTVVSSFCKRFPPKDSKLCSERTKRNSGQRRLRRQRVIRGLRGQRDQK